MRGLFREQQGRCVGDVGGDEVRGVEGGSASSLRFCLLLGDQKPFEGSELLRPGGIGVLCNRMDCRAALLAWATGAEAGVRGPRRPGQYWPRSRSRWGRAGRSGSRSVLKAGDTDVPEGNVECEGERGGKGGPRVPARASERTDLLFPEVGRPREEQDTPSSVGRERVWRFPSVCQVPGHLPPQVIFHSPSTPPIPPSFQLCFRSPCSSPPVPPAANTAGFCPSAVTSTTSSQSSVIPPALHQWPRQ